MKMFHSLVVGTGYASRALLVAVSLLLASVEWGGAQAQAPAAETADPFVKDAKGKGGSKAKGKGGSESAADAKASGGSEGQVFENIAEVVEFIEVPTADLRLWLKKNPGAPDAAALRAEVQKWDEAGSAEVLASQMLIARSGQRAKIESVRELIYPTEFDPAREPSSAPFSVAFETRNVGFTLEVDPVIDEDGSLFSNLAPEWVDYVGPADQRPEPAGTVQAGDVRTPLFHTIRPSLQVKSEPEEWRLLTTETARSKDAALVGDPLNAERSVLVFQRAAIQAFEVPSVEGGDRAIAGEGHLRFEWIDVDQAIVTQWLQQDSLGPWVGGEKGSRLAVEALVEKGEAEVVFTRLNPFISGQRMKSESIREVIYPSEFRCAEHVNSLSTARARETRNTGTTVETDPVVVAGGAAIDLNLAAEIVSLVGHSTSQRYLDPAVNEWKPDVMMPIFYTMRQSTQVSLEIDRPLLVGIMMPQDADGQPDRRRRRLFFVTATR